jgi:hypothetical protein
MRIAASYLLLPAGGVLLLSDDVAAGFSFALLLGLSFVSSRNIIISPG